MVLGGWIIPFENIIKVDFWRAVGSEFIATAILIFIGCGSVELRLNDEAPTNSSNTVRIALAFGFAVNILIKTFRMRITNPLTIGLTVSALHLVGVNEFCGIGSNYFICFLFF